MSSPKEPFFFECEYDRGIDFYRQKYFSHYNGEAYAGESRHRNLYLPYVASRVYRTSPGAKLIVILRDPAERALSHWWQYHSRKIDLLPFDAAIKEDMARIDAGIAIDDEVSIAEYCSIADNVLYRRSYVDSGYYMEQINRYTSLFGRQNLLVLLTEDLSASFHRTSGRIFEFLGLKPGPGIEEERKNRRKLMEAGEGLRTLSRMTGIHFLLKPETKEILLRWSQSEALLRWRYRKTMSKLRAHFRPHNDSLSAWLGRDLSSWNG